MFALTRVIAQPSDAGVLEIVHPVTPDGGTAPNVPFVIHDPYAEDTTFVVRHLRLGDGGPILRAQPGQVVHAQLETNFHCVACTSEHNHILIGFAGSNVATACAYSGPREAGGWRTEHFRFMAPRYPGVYAIRARSASTRRNTCSSETLAAWTIGQPNGPGAEATIGAIVVEPPAR